MTHTRCLAAAALALSVAVISGCRHGGSSGSSGSSSQPSNSNPRAADTTAPAAPSSLSAVAAGKHAVDLDWPDAAPADGVAMYTIFCDGAPSGAVSRSDYQCAGLDAGSTHSWIVYAQDSAGNISGPSPLAVATTSMGAIMPTLGKAYPYVVLAGTSVDNVGDSQLWGRVGTSPGTSMTGFPPGQLFGGAPHINDANAIAAMADATLAASFMAGQEADYNVTGQDLIGLTLTPGVYEFNGSAMLVGPGAVKLDGQGDPNAVWIFKVASDLVTMAAAEIQYVNEASVYNVYWEVSGSVSIDAATFLEGTIIANGSIDVGTSGGVIGRALALGGSVTADSATIYLCPTDAMKLASASEFAVFAGSDVQNSGAGTVVNGDLGVSPGTSLIGFPPGTLNGAAHLNDAVAIQAASDLALAYADAATRGVDYDFTGIDIGGQTLASGQYRFTGTATANGALGDIVLDARYDPKAIWIFMISADLLVSPGTKFVLARGAKAENVYWQVSGTATIGAASDLKGSIMADGFVLLGSGVNLDGRSCSLSNAVIMNDDVVSKP